MKIGHVCPYYPPAIGGLETCVYNLAREQAKKGHDIVVVTTSLPPSGHESFVFTHTSQQLDDVKVLSLGSFIFRETPISAALVSYLCKADFDILHLHLASMPFQPEVSAFLARLRGIPIVSHVHIEPKHAPPWLGAYMRLASQVIFNLSRAIIVPTNRYAQLIAADYGHRERLSVIPYGIDLSSFALSIEEEYKNANLLFVGRISYQKGLDRLIAAMKDVLRIIPKARLTIVGPQIASERSYYLSLSRTIDGLGLGSCVRFLGPYRGDRLAEVYRQASVFVAPSRFESFGIVLLEAMASGVPIVASNIAEFEEITKGSALLVDPSPQNLSDAIARVILDKDMRGKMVESARKRVQDFSWTKMAEHVLSLYNRCLG